MLMQVWMQAMIMLVQLMMQIMCDGGVCDNYEFTLLQNVGVIH
jgi:hypothetical protein